MVRLHHANGGHECCDRLFLLEGAEASARPFGGTIATWDVGAGAVLKKHIGMSHGRELLHPRTGRNFATQIVGSFFIPCRTKIYCPNFPVTFETLAKFLSMGDVLAERVDLEVGLQCLQR